MEIFLLDDTFRTLYTLDLFESLIWTERYNGYGDFELYMPIDQNVLDIADLIRKKMEAKKDFFLWLKDSGSAMVIENLEITTNTETGNHLTMSGRGLESLLERRIIWKQTSLNGKLQDGIKRLINESIISPEISERKIANFVFSNSSNSYITSLTLNAQYTGDNLYDTIFAICDAKQLGFDVMLDDNSNFVFSLRYREDRSYDQEKNPYVIFSPKFENFINSDYLESIKTLKNVTLVAGEDSGSKRKTQIVGAKFESGLSRRELYTDARDIQSESYRENVDADIESLKEFKEKLPEAKKALNDVVNAIHKEEENYQKKSQQLEELRQSYLMRLASFQERINFYNNELEKYSDSLSPDSKTDYVKRKEYKIEIESRENSIKNCENKINSYNNSLKNEKFLNSGDIEVLEFRIEEQEDEKSTHEKKKSSLEQKKSEIESRLPNFKDMVSKPEERITKYESIVTNDQTSFEENEKAINEENSRHNQQMDAYDSEKNEYEQTVNHYQDVINHLESDIAAQEQEIQHLYNELLEQRGIEKLSENVYTKTFTGEIDATKTFVYDKDFFKGDIVQISNEYGMSTKAKVSELVRAQDTSGYTTYPTFQIIE